MLRVEDKLDILKLFEILNTMGSKNQQQERNKSKLEYLKRKQDMAKCEKFSEYKEIDEALYIYFR